MYSSLLSSKFAQPLRKLVEPYLVLVDLMAFCD
jgi:hypothetical protein